MKDPRTLRRFVSVFSLLALLGITSFVGFHIHLIYQGHIIRNAEEIAVKLGYVVFEREKKLLMTGDHDGRDVLFVDQENLDDLDQRIRVYLEPLNIVKIKFFDAGKKVIYSSDRSIIGKADLDNGRLDKALEGGITSQIVKRGSLHDLTGETLFDVDVVETYFPVVAADNRKIGAFETYEEFPIMLPDTSAEKSKFIAERIRTRLREDPMNVNGELHHVTASFGIACYTGQDQTIHQIVQQADERMYEAKRGGKDCRLLTAAGESTSPLDSAAGKRFTFLARMDIIR